LAKKKTITKKSKKMRIREYARYKGVPQSTIQYSIKTGIIGRTKDGWIDVKKADVQWEENRDPSYTKDSNKSTKFDLQREKQIASESVDLGKIKGKSLKDFRTAERRYKAELARLEYLEKSSSLISAEEVKRGAFKCGRIFRDGVLNLIQRIASELAIMQGKNEHEISAYLDREAHKMLTDLSHENKWGKRP